MAELFMEHADFWVVLAAIVIGLFGGTVIALALERFEA